VRNEKGTATGMAAVATPGLKAELLDETATAQVVISGLLEGRPPDRPQLHTTAS